MRLLLSILLPLALFGAALAALTPYTGPPPPTLPNRKSFGYAGGSTGGCQTGSVSYIVTNAPDLRAALKVTGPKIIYVKGTIQGNQTDTGIADCKWYLANSAVPQFDFTSYLLSLNSTYMALVAAAADTNGTFEGKNATEYQTLLKKMNGWRPQAQNAQKTWVGMSLNNDTSIIGWDANAKLAGVNLSLNVVNNIHIRNLILEPPQDCFPAPETYPDNWNARYDAISVVTSTNLWVDGNILQDGPKLVPLEPAINGWYVDRFDGLCDVEDGSDNITFSHNIVRNHHKSLLWGGGNKEADRDLGKMKFTVFANHFKDSQSRNPLLRFGTAHIQDNLYESANGVAAVTPPVSTFENHIQLYNQSKVLVAGNVFLQTGTSASDTSRIFTYKDLTSATTPAKLCVKSTSTLPAGTFNGAAVDLQQIASSKFNSSVSSGSAVSEGLVFTCSGTEFVQLAMPTSFASPSAVQSYVTSQAGSH